MTCRRTTARGRRARRSTTGTEIYNRNQVGYHGPTYNYASMPDQYIYSALQRLELGKRHRRPLFAEVDTVSSHEPWKNIPQMTELEQGRERLDLQPTPEATSDGGAFFSDHSRVQAAYGQSIVYALNALTSFVQRYGRQEPRADRPRRPSAVA